MSSRKRSRDAEPDMSVKTSHGEPLPAESFVLRTFSSCARELPASAAEWDVSGFLYQGQPFTHETVKCWLSCAYSVLHGPPELDADDTAQLSTAKGLHAVLSFAHAVGSPAAVFTAACSQLDSLKIVAQLPEQTLEFELSSQRSYGFVSNNNSCQLCCGSDATTIGQPVSQQQEQDAKQQVAEQTGALLHLAHVLRLQPLISALHDFSFYQSNYSNSVLYGVLELVFSDATVEAALGSGTVSKEAYITSALTRPCSFVDGVDGQTALFKPVGKFKLHNEHTGRLDFEAHVLQEFAGFKAGESATAELNLFGGGLGLPRITVTSSRLPNPIWFPAQLLLGYALTHGSNVQRLMRGRLPQQS